MEAEAEDVLSDSLQALYGYTPITHGSAGSFFNYNVPNSALHPQLDPPSSSHILTLVTPDTQSNNWSLHASSIWASSLYIADHLADLRIDHHLESAHRGRGLPLRVLELGAGAGLPGILIAKVYKDVLVVSSDYPDESLIQTLRGNVERNGVTDRCRAVPYAWGDDPSSLLASSSRTSSSSSMDDIDDTHLGFDVIIAADTLWNPDLHTLFLHTLRSVLRGSPDSRIYLVAGLHTGRYTLQKFMDLVPEFGLRVVELEEREANGSEIRAWDVTRAECEDEKERRRWVVWISLAKVPV